MADSILDTITTMTGLGADPVAEAVTEAQKQLVLEVNHVSGGYRTPGLFATARSWGLSARAEQASQPWPE